MTSPARLPDLRDFARIVFFTGAGLSAECGIPTYRGAGGIWQRYRYEDYGDVPGNIPERSRNDVNGRVAANFLRVFGIAEFGQSAEFLLPFNDTSGWIARGTTRLSFPIASGWSFANTLALEYFNTPPSGSKSFELDYIISLVYAF